MASIKRVCIKGQNYDIKSTYDINGKQIDTTYATKSELSNETLNRTTNETTFKANISALEIGKQDKLTAGMGIDITDNVISVLGWHYSKFTFDSDSGQLSSVEGECATAFNTETQQVDMTAMIKIFPFNQIKRKEVQLQYTDGSNLNGTDMFTTFSNSIYYCDTIGEDGKTETIEFANYKAGDNFKRCYDDNNISTVGIGCYLACEDTDNGAVIRSSNAIVHATYGQGALLVNKNQATIENELPYLNGEKVDCLDSRVYNCFRMLFVCFIGYRNAQAKYRGQCDWGTSTWNYYTDMESKVKDAHLRGTWLAGATDTLVENNITMTGEVTSWTEDDVTTEIASGKRPFAILGVENPYGLIWQNISGLYHIDQNLYQYQGTSHKSNSKFDVSDCELIADNLCSSSGWQNTLASSSNMVYPITVGGSDSKLVGDYYWYSGEEKIFFVGGNWRNGSSNGLSSWLGSNGFGSASAHVGFRLSIKY